MEYVFRKVLSHFLLALEIDAIQREKHKAVRNQDFESAVKYRDMENTLSEGLLSFDELKKLRDQLNQLP